MSVAFLLDVDNTLLDNDAAKVAIADGVAACASPADVARFWQGYDHVRDAVGYVDLPGTVARFRDGGGDARCADAITELLARLPYADYVYPGALAVLQRLRDLGRVGLLSDGDPVFQPEKIRRAGLAAAVDAVFVQAHKERELVDVLARLPADRHVFVDDRSSLLGRIKERLGAPAVTVHVLQGHYADEVAEPAPDHTIARIADLAALAPAL